MARIGNAYVEPLRWWERLHCTYLDAAWYAHCWHHTRQWKRTKRRR